MENIIQSGIQNLMSWVYSGRMNQDPYEQESAKRQALLGELYNYYEGRQRKPLRTSASGRDYNVMANLTGVIVDRSVSMLIGAGVDFNPPDEMSHEYIDHSWDANRGDILLHDLAQFGGIYGTAFLKIIPDAREYKGKVYPRLIALNPYNIVIATAPDDIESIWAYVVRWNVGDVAWREITERREGVWYVRMEMSSRETDGKWAIQGNEITWPYAWAPIAHCKNLPMAGSVYGRADIEGVIDLQDKYNASQSDINVILANNAFPLRYTSGGKLPRIPGTNEVDISPSKIIEFASENAKLNVAEMSSDLSSSRSFASDLRRDMHDISQTVDAETLRQNASSITNFGLRVMYKDELAKNNTKQMLYGQLLCDVNSHLLEMAGLDTDAGDVVWGDPLPTNPIEEITALEKDQALGLVSKKTMSQIRDYDYDAEQAQIAEEKRQSNALGGNMLRDFLANKNQTQPETIAAPKVTDQNASA